MRIIVEVDDKLYEVVEHTGRIACTRCDLPAKARQDLCSGMGNRAICEGPMTYHNDSQSYYMVAL